MCTKILGIQIGHDFGKWEITSDEVEKMNVGSIRHADHSKKHIIEQKRICFKCGYTQFDLQIKWS